MHHHWARWPFAIAIPVLMMAWVAVQNIQEDRAALEAPFRQVRSVTSDEERQRLESLLAESYAVLRSPEMEANLRALGDRYPVIFANAGRQTATADEVADLLALKKPGARYVPADVWLTDVRGGFLGMAREADAGEGRYADIVLIRPLLQAWRSPDVVLRSCAVNVAAHEYAHTLSTTPFVFRTAFTDTTLREDQIPGRRDRSTPVASYMIGSVAQCTWLQKQGRVPPSGLAACVEVFGTAAGNPERCLSFGEGQPVAPRPGLPEANPGL